MYIVFLELGSAEERSKTSPFLWNLIVVRFASALALQLLGRLGVWGE